MRLSSVLFILGLGLFIDDCEGALCDNIFK